jgi:hypothetical protein
VILLLIHGEMIMSGVAMKNLMASALCAFAVLGGVSKAEAIATASATASSELYKSTTLVTGTSMTVAELAVVGPGTLTIELKDMNWPGLLDTLSFSLTDSVHALQTYTLGGAASRIWTYSISAPSTLYAAIFAKPSSTSKAGMYYANVSYQSVPPVPLPAAAWFLISGLASVAAFRPKQKLSQISV